MNRVYCDEFNDLIVETDSYLIHKESGGGFSINVVKNPGWKNWMHFPSLQIPEFSYKNANFNAIENYLNKYFKLKIFW